MAPSKTPLEFLLPPAYYFNEDGSHSRARAEDVFGYLSDRDKNTCKFCTQFALWCPTDNIQLKAHAFEHPKGKTRAIRPYPWIHVHRSESDLGAHAAWKNMMSMFPSSIWLTDERKFETTKIVLAQVVHPVVWTQQTNPYFPVPPYLAVNSEARLLLAIKSMAALSQTTTCGELVLIYREMIKFCLSARYLPIQEAPAWTLDLEQTQILRTTFTYLLEFVDGCRTFAPSQEQLEAFCEAYTRLIRHPARDLELTPWDLTMTLTDFTACTDGGKCLTSKLSLRKMLEFYQTGAEILSERVGDGNLLARRHLQILMSVDYNELMVTAGFEHEQGRIIQRTMRTMAQDLGFALELEVSVLHAKPSDPPTKLREPPVKPCEPYIEPCETPATHLTDLQLLTSGFAPQLPVVEQKEDHFVVGDDEDQPQRKSSKTFDNFGTTFTPRKLVRNKQEMDGKKEVDEKKKVVKMKKVEERTVVDEKVIMVAQEGERPKRIFNNFRNKIGGMSLFGQKQK